MRVRTLDNGVRYIINNTKYAQVVSISILFKVGSRNEPKKYYGISHFIEHMMFKGTKKRPNSKEIVDTLYRYGADINAFTSKDVTGYYVVITPEHIDKAVEVLSDIIFNSKFSKKDIESEKNVVINELERTESNPNRKIIIMNDELIYKGTSLQHPIVGTKKDIYNFNKSMVLDYLSKHYRLDNMLITISGNTHKDIIKCIGTHFGNKYFKYTSKSYKDNFKNNFNNTQSKIRFNHLSNSNEKQSQVCISIPTYSFEDNRKYTVEIIGTILAGNMGSRLFIKLREKLGLVYSIKYGSNIFEDNGNLKILFSTFNNKESIEKCLQNIIHEFNNMKKYKIPQEELNYNVDYLIGKLLLSQENSKNVSIFLGENYLFKNKYYDYEDLAKEYRKVKIKNIYDVSNDIFDINKLNISIISSS